jgi:ketosteroid isomerase-like protein
MADEQSSFDEFIQQRRAAAQAFVNGDGAPVSKLSSASDLATFFGPGGGHLCQGSQIRARYEQDARAFESGSENTLQILHAAADDNIGYWVGFQRTQARLKGNPNPVPMSLRVTEVFRREADGWKLIHRHADMLAEEQE